MNMRTLSESAVNAVVPQTEKEKALVRESQILEKQADALTISGDADIVKANNLLGSVSKLGKDLEKERKGLVDPLNNKVREINSRYKPFTEKLDQITRAIKKKMVDYNNELQRQAQEKERKRLEAEAKAKEEAEAKFKEQQAEAEKTGDIALFEFPEPIPQQEEAPAPLRQLKTSAGTSTFVEVWKWELRDFSMVPDRFIIPAKLDEVAINKAVRAGERNIPGLRIYPESEVRTRAAG